MPIGKEALLTPPPPPSTPLPAPSHADLSGDLQNVLTEGENAVATYIATPGSTLGEKLKSRKLWAAIFGVVLSILFAVMGAIPHAEALKSGTILGVAYLAVEGLVDAMSALGLGGG